MKLFVDWTDSDPKVREAVDFPFAESKLIEEADYAQCGRFAIEENSTEDLVEHFNELSRIFSEAADKIEDKDMTAGGNE